MRCLFVLILQIFFFLAVKLIGQQTGCQFFKKMSIFPAPGSLTPVRQVGRIRPSKESENLSVPFLLTLRLHMIENVKG